MKNGVISLSGNQNHWDSHTIDETNRVNGKPVFYFKNRAGIPFPSGAGQVILANCAFVTIENLNESSGASGLLIGYSSNITISNCTFSKGVFGVDITASHHFTIRNTTCIANIDYGISIWRSTHGTLENNTISKTESTGLYISKSSILSIRNNLIDNNYVRGISIFRESNDIQIINNSITGNRDGIQSYSDCYGIIAHYNKIFNNTEYGIRLWVYSDENIISNLDARFNYWGDVSGPYNNETNPEGTGDNITLFVRFDPWLDEYEDLQSFPDDPEDPEWIPLFLLLVILVGLFLSLVHIVLAPEVGFGGTQNLASIAGGAHGGAIEDTNTGSMEVTCQFCLQRFTIKEADVAIRVNCPHCGKDTLRDHLSNR